MSKNQHKQFIVCGASTSGKTTFCHELVRRHHMQHIQIDPILEAFEDVFPELGITHNANTHEKHLEVCEKFRAFLCRMIDGLNVDNFVIEGFRMPLGDLYKKYEATHHFFVFGFPTLSAEEKLHFCRTHDTNNWTNDMKDDELLDIFQFLIEESRYLQEDCARFGIPFFDTGGNYREQVDKALQLAEQKFADKTG